MSEQIQFVIVGAGSISDRHAKNIDQLGNLLAVCDILPERADALARKYGARSYHTIEELLEAETKTDVVVVCTPNGLHADHSIRALEAGFHVLCEKPMALTVGDCNNMIEAARKAGKYLFIVKQNRFNPPVVAVKKVIDEGRLGKIYSIQLNCFWNRPADYYNGSWKGTKELDGGTLFTQFSHFIDLLYWMIGDVKDVNGFSANYDHQGLIDFEDTGVAVLRFADDVIGTINFTVNSHAQNMEGSLSIFAEKGTVKIGGQYLNELEYQNIKDYRIENLATGNPPNEYGKYQGSMSNHDKVYENLIGVLKGRELIATNGQEGLMTVAIIEKIYASFTSL